ncbi:uncharacterized protein LOC143886384 [Tasmannia lanceolata]|uniref:uncharacterized protein LOC143886384 n=1 Tax=Tasmannia lanceolata TaxID=3420 RepID=UPI0040646F9F
MAVEDDGWKSIFSQSDQRGNELSPEDTAWVDSCLVKDPALSTDNWSALQDALLDILSSHTIYEPSSTVELNEIPEENDEYVPTSYESETRQVRYCLRDDVLPNCLDLEENGDDHTAELAIGSSENAELENIFRVWDLDVTFEEDGLVKQLKKALSESSRRVLPSTPSDTVDTFDEQNFGDLVASMADLSLRPCTNGNL